MADSEKVICALENCAVKPKCKNCPWDTCEKIDHATVTIPLDLATGILELLKAQEPRVLTLEEAQSVDYCWYESRTANDCILCSAHMATNRNGKSKTEFEQMGSLIRGFQYDERYGISWRCWSSRPTDEQREKEKWNG